MSKSLEKEMALQLRKQGFSYREILEKVRVAKSTLSAWLHSVGLSKKQKQRLTEKKLVAMKKGWLRVRQIRIDKTQKIKETAKNEVSELIKNPLWLAGVMLYWAEGAKEKVWRVGEKIALSNMDPYVHILFVKWLKQFAGIEKADLVYEIYIHERADVEKAKLFWGQCIGVPQANFRVYFKKYNPNSVRKNIGREYNGVLRIYVHRGIDLNRKIAGWVEGVIEYLQ